MKKLMTLADIKARIKAIKACAHDAEKAHGMEDDLYRDVLEAIANDCLAPIVFAKEVLKAGKIDFARWGA